MTKKYSVAVFIGRMQPVHKAHLGMVEKALAVADEVVVVLGSSFRAANCKNPFTAEERQLMLDLSLSEEDRARVSFLPIRDCYKDSEWVRSIRQGVEKLHPTLRNVVVVGHSKDDSSYYLNLFDGWAYEECASLEDGLNATDIRNMIYACDGTLASKEALQVLLADKVPKGTLAVLNIWMATPTFAKMQEEAKGMHAYTKLWAAAPYKVPMTTVDCVITCQDKVLLVERDRAPGKGLWALPGGYLEVDERVYQGALRELAEETGLKLLPSVMEKAFKGAAVFDHPNRSLHRIITHAHYFDLGDIRCPDVQGCDDARSAKWVPISSLKSIEDQFHDDHFSILKHFLNLVV